MKSASRTGNAYAAILAGGSGTRMGNPDKPKQFLMLGSKPILVHTVEKFCVSGEFDAVLVLCPETWVQQTKDLLAKYSPHYAQEVTVIAGGATRNDTVTNAVSFIEDSFPVDDDTVLVTHDAVRPFVTHRIIADNLYQGQTPQSFNLLKLKGLMGSLSEEEKELLTDACKVFVLRGEKVSLVMGEPDNIKITYPQDMRLASALVGA